MEILERVGSTAGMHALPPSPLPPLPTSCNLCRRLYPGVLVLPPDWLAAGRLVGGPVEFLVRYRGSGARRESVASPLRRLILPQTDLLSSSGRSHTGEEAASSAQLRF